MTDEYAVPILPSRDLQETFAYYERLGFHWLGAPSGNLIRDASTR